MNMTDDMVNNLSHKIDNDIIYNIGINNANLYETIDETKLTLSNNNLYQPNIIINDKNGNELVKIDVNTGDFYIKRKLTNNNELVGRYLSMLGQHNIKELIKKELSNNPDYIEEIITDLRREKLKNITK